MTDELPLDTGGPRRIQLMVAGTPAPQGSKSAFVRGGRAVLVDGGSKSGRESHQAWRQSVATAARDWQVAHDMPALLDGPVELRIVFSLVKPRSKPRWKWLPDTKPDLDKLIRTVLDALSGVVITDDARVIAICVVERFVTEAGAGAEIELTDLTSAERRGEVIIDGMKLTYTQ